MISLSRVLVLLFCSLSSIFLFSAFLFPIHNLPWPTFYNEWLFACGIAILALCVVWVDGEFQLQLSSGWVLALIFSTLLALWFRGKIGSNDQGIAIIFFLYCLLACYAYQVGVNLKNDLWLYLVLSCVCLAALISATIALLQWSGIVADQGWGPAFIAYSEGGRRVSSNIGQANNLGTLLVMGMGAIGYAWYAFPRVRLVWHALSLLGIFLLVLGVYVSGSRTAVLNILTWPVLLSIWAVLRRHPFPWLALFPIGSWLVLQAVMPLVIEWWGLFPVQEARSLVQDSNRLRLWEMVLTAIGESPWLGHGFGAVANAHLRLSPEFGAFDYSIAQHAHNTVLDMWAIFGLPLGTLIVGGVLWLAAKAWWRSTAVTHQFVWLMCSAMLVHSLLEYPLHYGFFLWLLFLLFGLLAGEGGFKITFKRPAIVSAVWLTLVAVLAVSVLQRFVHVESLYAQYRYRGDLWMQNKLKDIEQDGLLDKMFFEPYERLYWISKPVEQMLKLNETELRRLERQALYYPLPAIGWRVAMAHTAQGRYLEASWWADRMCAMYAKPSCNSGRQELEKLGLKPN